MSEQRDEGAGPPLSELAERLRTAMVEKGWNQAQLVVKSRDLSKATVSNVLGAKHVPSADTLDKLATALGFEGQSRKELHALRDAADGRGRRLSGYLAAAERAARGHPYPWARDPVHKPSIDEVYREQRAALLPGTARSTEGGAGPAVVGAATVAAAQLLDEGDDCVLLAGPGGGKSSLLRVHMARLAERRRAGRGGNLVPVLVPASALGRLTLPAALAEAVTEVCGPHGLWERPTESFFASAPGPGARWQVLIDGLDEVTDRDARRAVLDTVAATMAGEHARLYRFVLTTRPLGTDELDVLGHEIRRYELRPFDADEVADALRGWFRALKSADPEQFADRLMERLARNGLAHLARTPLMAAMLCQLYAADPERQPSGGRSDVYAQFVALLRERAVTGRGITGQAGAALERFGGAVVAQGEAALRDMPEAIGRLAAARLSGDEAADSAVDFVAALPEAACPKGVEPVGWLRFVRQGLISSGLLAEQGDRLDFTHWSLVEYLAARHRARDADGRAAVVTELIERRWSRQPSIWPWYRRQWSMSRFGITDLALLRYGMPTEMGRQDLSYAGFLLDAVRERDPDVDRRVLRVASRGGVEGATFVALLAQMGTGIGEEIRAAAVHTLASAARSPRRSPTSNRRIVGWQRIVAADTLLRIGDDRGMTTLTAVLEDLDLIDLPDMWNLRMVNLGFLGPYASPAAIEVARVKSRWDTAHSLVALVREPDMPDAARVTATRILSALGGRMRDPAFTDALASLAEDTTLDADTRALLRAETEGRGESG